MQKATNLKVLCSDFPEVILDVSERAEDGRTSTAFFAGGVLTLRDGSKLNIEEYLDKQGNVTKYHYNWLRHDGSDYILKFHSERHDNPQLQTRTEPHHVHVKTEAGASDRIPNEVHRDLYSIVEFMCLSFYSRHASI